MSASRILEITLGYQRMVTSVNDQFGTGSSWQRRMMFTRNICWGVPSYPCIMKIRDFCGKDLLVEINAGRGAWAQLLRLANVQMIATDAKPWKNPFTAVEKIDAVAAIHKYKPSILMTVWPCYNESFATEALYTFERFGGSKIIYCGEEKFGCCADDRFFDFLESKFRRVGNVQNPRFQGIYDSLSFYEKK